MTDYPLDEFEVTIVWADGGAAPEGYLKDAWVVRITEGGVLAVGYTSGAWRLQSPSSWRDVVVSPR